MPWRAWPRAAAAWTTRQSSRRTSRTGSRCRLATAWWPRRDLTTRRHARWRSPSARSCTPVPPGGTRRRRSRPPPAQRWTCFGRTTPRSETPWTRGGWRIRSPAMFRMIATALVLAATVASAQPSPSASPGPWMKKAEEGKELYATLKTSQGDIVVRLFTKDAPKTVENFVGLAAGEIEWRHPQTGEKSKKPLYDGTIFHRVIPQFMIQGGDPLGQGFGGPAYAIPDEIAEGERFFDQPCQLAYANSGPNSNGSQFVITEVATLHLNPRKCSNSPAGVCGY